MAGFFEQLSDKDKEIVKSWSKSAKTSRHERDIPAELFIGAKLGYFYGWEALIAFKLGYIIVEDIRENGEKVLVKVPYTFDEAVADVRSAEKVNYRVLVDNGDIIASANVASRDKDWTRKTIEYTNKIRKEMS